MTSMLSMIAEAVSSQSVEYVGFFRAYLFGGAGVALALNVFCAVSILFMSSRKVQSYDAAVMRMLGQIAAFEVLPLAFLTAYFGVRYYGLPDTAPDSVPIYVAAVVGYALALTGLAMPGICGVILSARSRT